MLEQKIIKATSAKYIKLGEQGRWEELCFKEGSLRLGFDEAPHIAACQGDKNAIVRSFLDHGYVQRTSTDFARQVMDFYNFDSGLLWITFSQGYLWWCRAIPDVEYLGDANEDCVLGSRLRKTHDGWHNTDIYGVPLRISDLSGHLTKVAAYRSTICDVNDRAFEYLLRKINGEHLPEVQLAIETHEKMHQTLEGMIKLLTWQDFELFVELIFGQSGWQRISAMGGAQKTVDLELVQPLTNETAVVQVKSQTSQMQLDSYLDSLSALSADRSFYVYHSADTELNAREYDVTLMDVSELAKSALRSGLSEWLIKKVG